MSKSLSQDKVIKTQKFIKQVIEPKFQTLIDEANKLLNKRGIHIGCDITWLMDKTKTKEENEDEEVT